VTGACDVLARGSIAEERARSLDVRTVARTRSVRPGRCIAPVRPYRESNTQEVVS
jgi:hypothetical protein